MPSVAVWVLIRIKMKPIKNYRKYEEYLLDDFLVDEFFIEWVKNPNPNNKHFWEKWMAEHPRKREVILNASDLIQRINYSSSTELSDKRYVEIFENVIRQTPPSNEVKSLNQNGFRKWFFSFRQIAAILLIGVSIWYVWNGKTNSKPIPVENNEELEWIVKTTPKGQKATYVLEDGSKIYVNSGSELTFPRNFGPEIRKVSLKGEAFFEVAEEKRPFIVQTGDISVEVLGTSFNVKESEKGLLSVALVTGKVRIDDQKGNRLMLDPSEMMVFDRSGEFRKTGFDPLEMTGWKDKTLVFKNNGIQEVKSRLENWYGVEITLKGKFPQNWSYSGIYQDETLENVLLGLSRATELTFSLKDKQVEIIHQ